MARGVTLRASSFLDLAAGPSFPRRPLPYRLEQFLFARDRARAISNVRDPTQVVIYIHEFPPSTLKAGPGEIQPAGDLQTRQAWSVARVTKREEPRKVSRGPAEAWFDRGRPQLLHLRRPASSRALPCARLPRYYILQRRMQSSARRGIQNVRKPPIEFWGFRAPPGSVGGRSPRGFP